MTTIWKYKLSPGVALVNLPVQAKVLTAAAQGDDIYLWASVDPGAPGEFREFVSFGTGEAIKVPTEQLTFISTAFLYGGSLVFHIFEIKKKE